MVKKFLVVGIAVLASLMTVAVALAGHSWNGYHWSSDNLNPTVTDKTSSSLYDVPAAVTEWAALGTPIQPVNKARGKGNITVSEGYSPNWLGIAQVFVEGGHITKGAVKMNTTLLQGYGAFVADHVLCQEIGHVLGLDHNHDDLDTCMNDGGAATTQAEWLAILNATGSDSPNGHDTEELNLSYGHDDGGGNPGPGPKPKPCKGKKCSQGRWVTVHVFPAP